eukprot:943195-Pelagomonas_calceolata.AAC.2
MAKRPPTHSGKRFQQQQQQQLQRRSRKHLQTMSLKGSPTAFTNEFYHALQTPLLACMILRPFSVFFKFTNHT